MKEKLEDIKKHVREQLEDVSTLDEWDKVRVKFLGKKGELTKILQNMGKMPKEERPILGKLANETRTWIEETLDDAKEELEVKELERKLKEERLDVTIRGRKKDIGHKHPLQIVVDELNDLFIGMGFEIAEGPDIETDYYNFEALNIPANHPAKDEQDTFYIGKDYVLRTQTSPVQVRVMEKNEPPIRIVCPGKVFRSDQVDATHSPVFHQIEGLLVDKDVTMGDLKGILEVFVKELFGPDTITRFRPHHFPFTEPSAEMDVSCMACHGKGCSVCGQSGYIELLGCGMVHPDVLRNAGIDPEIYSGYAFGMGLERIAMQRYGITDMRLLYENDIRFLEQF